MKRRRYSKMQLEGITKKISLRKVESCTINEKLKKMLLHIAHTMLKGQMFVQKGDFYKVYFEYLLPAESESP